MESSRQNAESFMPRIQNTKTQPVEDAKYFREREAVERSAAEQTQCLVSAVHSELAEMYAAKVRSLSDDEWAD